MGRGLTEHVEGIVLLWDVGFIFLVLKIFVMYWVANLILGLFQEIEKKDLKKIIFYWLCYCCCLNFPPFAPSTWHPHSLRQSPHHCSCPWVLRISSLALPFPVLYFTSPWQIVADSVHSVTTCLYFLIPSPLHPFPHNTRPSGNHQNPHCNHDSASAFLVCLVCFLDCYW